MFIFGLISKLLKTLNSDETPIQIAVGVALGAIVAFTPFLSLHNLFVIMLIFVSKVSFRSALTSMLLLSPVGLLIEPLAYKIGHLLLVDISSLHSFWVGFQNSSFLPFFEFNNKLILGSFIFSLLAFLPIVFLFKIGINKYRNSWRDKFIKTKAFKILSKSKFVGWAAKIYKFIPA